MGPKPRRDGEVDPSYLCKKRKGKVPLAPRLNLASSATRDFLTYGRAKSCCLGCCGLTLPGDVEWVRILQTERKREQEKLFQCFRCQQRRDNRFWTRQGRWRANAAESLSNNCALGEFVCSGGQSSARVDRFQRNAKMRQFAAPENPRCQQKKEDWFEHQNAHLPSTSENLECALRAHSVGEDCVTGYQLVTGLDEAKTLRASVEIQIFCAIVPAPITNEQRDSQGERTMESDRASGWKIQRVCGK